MFLHSFKYSFLTILRNREMLFWSLLFPAILGTFFFVAFGNLYESDELFATIPVAVVENQKDDNFKSLIDSLSQGDNPLLKAEYISAEEAEKKLSDGDVNTIVYVDREFSMAINSGSGSISSSIVRTIIDEYRVKSEIIADVSKNRPENLPAVIEQISSEATAGITDKPVTDGDMDVYIQYFFNLIAMAALFGAMSGMTVAINSQGNLSAIGARKCTSPAKKIVSACASLLATTIVQFFCVAISLVYIMYILGVNFGDNIGMIFLTAFLSGMTGVTLGYFVGSVGKAGEGLKGAILLIINLGGCFLSGLMVGDMRMKVDEFCPVINKINPAALISDSFFALSMCGDYERYIRDVATLLLISAVSIVGGVLFTRRQRYASL